MGEKIFFLGAGKMATAIAKALVKADPANKAAVTAFDPNRAAAEHFTAETGAEAKTSGAAELAAAADIVVLAVKPQYLKAAVEPLTGVLAEKLVVSIVAGIELSQLAALTTAARLVRVMPNTPALVGEGMSCYAVSGGLSAKETASVERILGAAGKTAPVDEKLLNAVTGLSGSGPAYVFEFIMALADGGVREGLPRDLALKLAVQTVLGSAKLAAEADLHPAQLRDQVISPGGTTAAGVAELERNGFRFAVQEAVVAASRRAAELGKK